MKFKIQYMQYLNFLTLRNSIENKMRYLEEHIFQHFSLFKESLKTMILLDTAFALSFQILYIDHRLSDYPKLQPPPCNCYVTFLGTSSKILRSFLQWTNFIRQRHHFRIELVKWFFPFCPIFSKTFLQIGSIQLCKYYIL